MFRQSLSKQIPVISLLTGATVWGLFWYPYRALAMLGMPGLISLTLSYAAALVFGLVFFGRRIVCQKFSWMLAGIGLSAGLCNFGYVMATIQGEIMRVLLLFYLAPFWTVLLSRVILGEKLTFYGYILILCAVTGAMTMLWSPSGIFPKGQAEWLGLGAGFMFALSNVLSKEAKACSVEARAASVSAGVVLAGLAFAFFHPVRTAFSFTMLLMLAIMGVAIFAVNMVMQYGLSHAPANRAIVILLFELVVAAFSSYLIAGEVMTLQEWIGGALIVAASLFSGKMEKS